MGDGMQIVSKFGIWDSEVKEFITKVIKETERTEEALKNWFYNEGLILFQDAQRDLYQHEVKSTQDKYGHKAHSAISHSCHNSMSLMNPID